MLHKILDIVFPRVPITEPQGYYISDEQWNAVTLDPMLEDTSMLRKRGIHALDSIFSATQYTGNLIIQKAIYALKYYRLPSFSTRLAKYLRTAYGDRLPVDAVITPVPLHHARQLERGFNQAGLLAHSLAEHASLPMQHMLVRVRDTGHQARRSRRERLTAMENAFIKKPYVSVPRHVIIVDDIATTGATLDACADILKQCGAQHVDAFVVARS